MSSLKDLVDMRKFISMQLRHVDVASGLRP